MKFGIKFEYFKNYNKQPRGYNKERKVKKIGLRLKSCYFGFKLLIINYVTIKRRSVHLIFYHISALFKSYSPYLYAVFGCIKIEVIQITKIGKILI